MIEKKELAMELDSIYSNLSEIEFNNHIDEADEIIKNLLKIIKENPISESVFENTIVDIFKKYNSINNTNLFLRQKRKEILNIYSKKDKVKAKEIMEEVMKYKKDNKLNFLENNMVNDIKYYIKYIDKEYYNTLA